MIPTPGRPVSGYGAALPGAAELDLVLGSRGQALSTLYQPIVDTARATVAGFEALTRFTGFPGYAPETWFDAASAFGRAEELESVAVRTALKARPMLPPNCFMALNLSPQLLASERVREIWEEEGDLGGLVIELTEKTPIDSYAALEPDLDRLRGAGALIAVDDAGAGYAGLRHLLALRPSMIKIDRDLVTGVDRDESRRALIEMLGTFASRIDAWIVAEGVERAGELEALVSLDVPLVQGYYLGRPSPPWAGINRGALHGLAARYPPLAKAARLRVRDIAEPAVTATGRAQALEAVTADPAPEFVVILGPHLRPVGILHGHGASNVPGAAAPAGTVYLVGHGLVTPGLRVNLDTPMKEALARAMTRPKEHRFEPLLVTDNAGRFAGLAPLERLIGALTRQ